MSSKLIKWPIKVLLWTVGIVLGITVIAAISIQIALRPKVMTGIVNQVSATMLTDSAKVHFGGIRLSIVKNFPRVSLKVDSVTVIYPTGTFTAPYVKPAVDSSARRQAGRNARSGRRLSRQDKGRGEVYDTLMTLKSLLVAFDAMEFYLNKSVHIPILEMKSPRIFVHRYGDRYNTDVIKPLAGILTEKKDSVEKADTTGGNLAFRLDRIRLTERPDIVFTDPEDTLELELRLRKMLFKGAIGYDSLGLAVNDINFSLDTMTVSGLYLKDSLNFTVSKLNLEEKDASYDFEVKSRARLRSAVLGRLRVPMDFSGQVSFPTAGVFTDLKIKNFKANVAGLPFDSKAFSFKLLSKGAMQIDGDLHVRKAKIYDIAKEFEQLLPFESSSLGQKASVNADLKAKGVFHAATHKMPDFNLEFELNDIDLNRPQDSIIAVLPNLKLHAHLQKSKGGEGEELYSEGDRYACITLDADSVNFQYKDALKAIARKLAVDAKSTLIFKKGIVPTMRGSIEAEHFVVEDSRSSRLNIRKMSNLFTATPKESNSEVPVLKLKHESRSISLRTPGNSLRMNRPAVDFTAVLNTVEKRQRAARQLDSLQLLYPDIERDSLRAHDRKMHPTQRRNGGGRAVEDEEFAKKNIRLDLGEEFKKYFRDWNIDGAIAVSRLNLNSPYFPLKTRLSDLRMHFDNNTFDLGEFYLTAGSSSLAAGGTVSGLRRVLLNQGRLNLALSVATDSLDVNQLLKAVAIGQSLDSTKRSEVLALSEQDDNSGGDFLVSDTTAAVSIPTLILPGNIEAIVSIKGRNIRYDDFKIDTCSSSIALKNRRLRIVQTEASTNLGRMDFEAYYASVSKQDIGAGFNLEVREVSAAKIIGMVPSVDTLVPLLKSFDGQLALTVAGMLSLDPAMKPINNSVRGIIRIEGDSLVLNDTKDMQTILRLLRFKERDRLNVKHLCIEGRIEDEKIEIFPFLLTLEKYNLALCGVQNFNNSFNYHVSLFKSPLLVKLGVDMSGNSFSESKFKLVRAKYRNADLPSFSTSIDLTRTELSSYINGILDAQRKANQERSGKLTRLDQALENANFVNQATTASDSLSAEEQQTIR